MIILHDPRSAEYARPDHPERPARVTRTAAWLRERHPDWQWRLPEAAPLDALLRAHSAKHVERVANQQTDFDADTPAYREIYAHAARASGAAITCAQLAVAGQPAFSLMRPPGHHATRVRAMGFCYFNHLAVAALDALERGVERVALWDFDAHHGNGTEEIVRGNQRLRFASVHQYPAYPGTGASSFANIVNFPLAPMTPRAQHLSALRQSLDGLLTFAPDLLLISAGFDAYARDPLTEMTLEGGDFATIGSWLRMTTIPTAAVLEGGYSDDLPLLVDAFLTAWHGG